MTHTLGPSFTYFIFGGVIPRHKVRLVVKRFCQRKSIDLGDIFSSLVRMSSNMIVLGLDASLNLEIDHMNVKTTFLHNDLEKEIYIEQPEGFKVDSKENFVCKLIKGLYGLKKDLRQWYKKFKSFIGEQGYKKTSLDHCVFVQKKLTMSLSSYYCMWMIC